jgi:hypothetical protein
MEREAWGGESCGTGCEEGRSEKGSPDVSRGRHANVSCPMFGRFAPPRPPGVAARLYGVVNPLPDALREVCEVSTASAHKSVDNIGRRAAHGAAIGMPEKQAVAAPKGRRVDRITPRDLDLNGERAVGSERERRTDESVSAAWSGGRCGGARGVGLLPEPRVASARGAPAGPCPPAV